MKRVLTSLGGAQVTSEVPSVVETADTASAYEGSWLRLREPPMLPTDGLALRIADLFSGVGGLSVGAWEASRAVGLRPEFAFAAEMDQPLLDAYSRNLQPQNRCVVPLQQRVDGELGGRLTEAELELLDEVGSVDLLLAGPPCQGNSDLNNHTRRDDDRNELYLRAVRFAEVFQPAHVLIENVPGVVHDRRGVVRQARDGLEALGYFVDGATVRAERVGVPQTRRRFFMLASRRVRPSVDRAAELSRRAVRPVIWAIDDLGGESDSTFGSSARHSSENRRRIAYLFEHDLYELPDAERPSCHRDKPHRYRSVYGRMRPDEPAPTITVGFGSTGQGRFVHPHELRTLTPHEAARVQTFPDWFNFSGLARRTLQKGIGNAVPPLLAAAMVRELIA